MSELKEFPFCEPNKPPRYHVYHEEIDYLDEHVTRGIDIPSHTDGISLNCSLWLDDEQVWEKGKPIHPELAGLAKKLENKHPTRVM